VKPATIAAATDKPLTDSRHKQFVTCGGIPFDSKGGINVQLLKERSFAVPKLRGWVMELAGDDDAALDLPSASPTTPAAVSNGLDLRLAFGDGAEVPAKVFRQGAFGFTNSPRAFGHDGMFGQQAWGDPATGISFAFVTNTMTERRQCLRRTIEMSTMANECALWDADAGDPEPAFVVKGREHLATMLRRLTPSTASKL
jgi:CubicO group peptidase (beta-lactamase class C family)